MEWSPTLEEAVRELRRWQRQRQISDWAKKKLGRPAPSYVLRSNPSMKHGVELVLEPTDERSPNTKIAPPSPENRN